MKGSTIKIAAPGGLQIHTHRWLPDGDTRAALLVIHGMAEHGGRYARLARTLTQNGIAVFALDLPGHGLTAQPGTHGHFADRNGWKVALDAVDAVRGTIDNELRRPVFLLGHSMGSFFAQHRVVERGAGLAGAIFSATTADMGALRLVGLTLIRLEALIQGRRHPSAIGEALSFKQFNKAFKPNRTEFDWLSRDDAEVDQYIADPLCGFRVSTALWIDVLTAGARLDDVARLGRIPKKLPVLLIAGGADPMCNGAAGPRTLEQAYRAAGVKDITVSIYDGGRHELLNDTCRDAVTEEIKSWLLVHL